MAETGTFKSINTFGTQAVAPSQQTEGAFVPWMGFGVVQPEGGAARGSFGTHPSFPMSPEEARQQRLIAEIEGMRQAALQEIETRQAQLAALEAELQQREQAIVQAETALQAQDAEIAVQAQALNGISAEFAEMKKGEWMENANEIVDFALALVERLILDRIVADPDALVRHIKAVLEEMKIDESILVHLSPDDLEALKGSKNAETLALIENSQIKWLGDMRLGRGEVHIDTSQYRLDASILTALKNVAEDLKCQDQRSEKDKAE